MTKWPEELLKPLLPELLALAQGSLNDLDIIPLLHKYGLHPVNELLNLLEQKRHKAREELKQLDHDHPAIDCTQLNNAFREKVKRQDNVQRFLEENRGPFFYCSRKENLTAYIQEIQEMTAELGGLNR
ncbi:hypothetical protein J7E73_21860 [Paenibacillus albidus]|uniref:hypothetical protein n=1 Tax=Paenibacillus albidus TaxID=2041023 RepID=UPI001BEC2C89|nr:hypothetical protein [Paenibacillus albidus]MBT2291723.1 hypothetical protein [Paenibacillus albidus]